MHLIRYLRHPNVFLIDLPSIPKLFTIFIQANFFLCPSLYSGDALFQRHGYAWTWPIKHCSSFELIKLEAVHYQFVEKKFGCYVLPAAVTLQHRFRFCYKVILFDLSTCLIFWLRFLLKPCVVPSLLR